MRATVITYVNPAVAAVLGVLVLGETLTPAMLIGFALAIAGSTLATGRPEPPEAEAAAVELGEPDERTLVRIEPRGSCRPEPAPRSACLIAPSASERSRAAGIDSA